MYSIDNYDIQIKNYYRMSFLLVEMELNLSIPLKVWQKYVFYVLDPLYNRETIFKHPIRNTKIGREENNDIQHWTRHVIQIMKDWVRKPFYLEPIPNVLTL